MILEVSLIGKDQLLQTGITVGLFVLGLLILLGFYIYANHNNKNPQHSKVVNGTYTVQNEQPVNKNLNDLSKEEYLKELYKMKYNNEITESEFNAAISRYLSREYDE